MSDEKSDIHYFEVTGTAEYSKFIHMSRYARWLEDKGRRETWDETVNRYITFWLDRFPELSKDLEDCREAILNFEVLPSMRALMTAGPALAKDNVAGYNCSFLSVDHPRAFDETMYVLMCGTGLGFSVERQFINKLPEVAEEFYETDTVITVHDSRIGWSKAFRELISLLYAGQIPQWDLSKLRPSGARLKTFGGRSSGPEPLNQLFLFTVDLFRRASGRKLSSIECHDLMCKIGEAVVTGGVRRSALLSLSNLSDDRMREAKSGQWYIETPHRRLANNSACYTEKPDFSIFLKEWKALYESKCGERGFFSRTAAQAQAEKTGRRDSSYNFGTNPCSEIILRSAQTCNLTEIIVRPDDTEKELLRKARVATILGTLQATLTDFRYLRKIWRTNCEEERLLGVSMTGIMDHPILGNCKDSKLPCLLEALKKHCVSVNKTYAKKLGINQSTAITCVKPAGTTSQLSNTASGIHPRFSKHYIRRVRVSRKDPICDFMVEKGFPSEVDVMDDKTMVFSFPIESPENCKRVDEISAIDQLKLWRIYQDYWCEHKPSCTVYYSDNEFLEVGQWLWDNFQDVSGLSFLPQSDHIYRQAPYEAVSKEKYEELLGRMPKGTDWKELSQWEKEDNTVGSKELACSAGVCEIVDL